MSKAEAFMAAIQGTRQQKKNRHVFSEVVSSTDAGDEKVKLLVSFVQDLTSFFGQQLSDLEEAVELSAKLAEFCPTAAREPDPELDKVYAAIFSEDNRWYRCIILRKIDCGKSYVKYMDYGNCEEVNHEKGLVRIPKELSEIRPLAVFCTLDGLVGLRKDDDPAAFEKAIRRMQKLLLDNIVTVKTKVPLSVKSTNSVTSCLLFDTGLDIMEEVINRGFCKKMEASSKDSTEVNTKESPAPLKSQDFQTRPNRDNGSVRSGSHADSQGFKPVPGRRFRAPLLPLPAPLPDLGECPEPGFIPKLRMIPHAEYIAQTKRSEAGGDSAASIEQLRSERNQLQAELKAKKAQIQALESKVVSKDAVGQGFASKLPGLITLLDEVKLQREQFSTDPEVKDVIEKALDEHGSCGQIIEPVPSVEAAIVRLQTAQDVIRNCVEKYKVEVLVAERDAAFGVLLQELQALEEVSEEVGQTVDVERIKSVLDELNQAYSAFCKNSGSLSLDTESVVPSLKESYQTLKQVKGPGIHEMRQETDVARKAVLAQLQGLQQVLQGVKPDGIGKEFSLSQLDMWTDNLQNRVEAEVSACSLALSDASLPALVQRLAAELQGIIDQATKSSAVLSRYRSLFREMSIDQSMCWHNAQQKTNEASQLLRELRKFKSELRHRLADFEDVEHSDEEMAAEVSADISSIRGKIQATFLDMELVMEELCQVHSCHFPELEVLYPELDLALHQVPKPPVHAQEQKKKKVQEKERKKEKYNALLKPYWDLSTFSTQKSGSVLKTVLADQDMTIVEYALDEAEDLHRLLMKANDYNLASSPNLVPIRAAFQSKDQRHAYLLVPFTGTPLAKQDRPVPRLILRQVLSALKALHETTAHKPAITHGRIHPGWILVSAIEQPVCLDLPDFQLGKSYLLPTADGVDFTAPELRCSNAKPTPASDMYSFGCLMMWALYPSSILREKFQRNLGPASQLCGREDLILIRSLQSPNPDFRPPAAKVLQAPFFASEISLKE